MKIPEHLITYITDPAIALWISNCDKQNFPEPARPTGVVKGESDDELIIYLHMEN